jgi:hypothetical protein
MPRLLVGVIGTLLYTLGLIGGAFLGLGTILPLMVLWPAAYRTLLRTIRLLWGYYLGGIMRYWFGVRLFVSGDDFSVSSPARMLLISNHRTRLDWLYLWSLSLFTQTGPGLRIILKAGLKHVPFFGWALQQFECLFIKVPHWFRAWLHAMPRRELGNVPLNACVERVLCVCCSPSADWKMTSQRFAACYVAT